MSFEQETLHDAVLFVLNNSSKTDPNFISTVIYVADLYHLIVYGRTIVDSIHDTKYYLIEKEDMEKIINEVINKRSDYKYLSKTDRESLKFAITREELCREGGLYPVPKCFGVKNS